MTVSYTHLDVYKRQGYFRPPPRIFAGTFGDSAPTGVAGDIDHRRVEPVDAESRSLFGSDPSAFSDQFRIPTARDGQRDRKYGFIAVDHVETDQQRNAEPRLLDGDLLRFLRRGGRCV